MSGTGTPPILVVVRSGPVASQTAALVESIAQQKPAGVAKVVLLSLRDPPERLGLPWAAVECAPADADWMSQLHALASRSGCRWLVLPASVDRYLPGAFESVLEAGAREAQAVVGACQVADKGATVALGPNPFRFDYFALLSGFNYIAPGATFLSIGPWLAAGAFDARFPIAPVYEFLLRTGAAGGVASCALPILETEARPFPGVPAAWAPRYAAEMLSIALEYNKSFLAPGVALGVSAALAEGLETQGAKSLHDEELLRRLGAGAQTLKARYVQSLRSLEAVTATSAVPTWLGALRLRIRAAVPAPIWRGLRRSRRAWQALREPLD
jgi:hypothetical protein